MKKLHLHVDSKGQNSNGVALGPAISHHDDTLVPTPNVDRNINFDLKVSRTIHALIIDDNKDLARLFADILEVIGCTVSVASSGEAGLATSQAKIPDIIFCDINMPGAKNGLDVAMEIRANKDFKNTLLVAITGLDDVDSLREARAAGFDYVFGKPIKFAQLKEVVETYARIHKK